MVEAITVIRSLHILFAVLWAGGGLHYARVSGPHAKETGVHAQFLANSLHGPFMGLTSLGTVGFGLATYIIMGGDAYSTAGNAILGTGALGAVVGLFVGFGGHLPLSMRIKAALAENDDILLQKFVNKDAVYAKISMVGITVALVAMVTFRWF